MARAIAESMIAARGPFQGVTQIIRYNWPYYFFALLLVGAGVAVALWAALPAPFTWIILLGTGLTAFWSMTSILVSFYIYDVSPLYRWEWLAGLLNPSPRNWVNLHAGLDETTEAVRLLFPASQGRTFDIYDPLKMSERSIERARSSAKKGPSGNNADFRGLPIADSECDAAFLIFSAHEIRDWTDRLRFFNELHRILKPDGTLVLVEHLRDVWNFAAYGPGFRHFYARAEWTRVAEEVGLSVQSERSITPFVRCFVFSKAMGK